MTDTPTVAPQGPPFIALTHMSERERIEAIRGIVHSDYIPSCKVNWLTWAYEAEGNGDAVREYILNHLGVLIPQVNGQVLEGLGLVLQGAGTKKGGSSE